MSSAIKNLLGLPDDPREIEFIRSLALKTSQGKIAWRKEGSAYTTTIPGGITVSFVYAQSIMGGSEWQMFTARNTQSEELVRISSPGAYAFLMGQVQKTSLVSATNDLFAAIKGTSATELDRAIDSLKKL